MRVICAPDKFKGSLTAAEAAEAMARGVRRAAPDAVVDLCPIADGGEGTVAALVAATGGETRTSFVTDPIHRRVEAAWGLLGENAGSARTAVIEMAAASGLVLVPPEKRDPTRTTTFGTGELILNALGSGTASVLLGIGGSATNDGGCGMAAACGVRFIVDGRPMGKEEFPVGGTLQQIERIDMSQLDPRLRTSRITVACDVTNPLTGPNGAAAIYGPQKGATPEQVKQLDAGLAHLARLWREQLGVDVENLPGAGAAGGLGGGLVAFFGAKLERGVDMVLRAVRFEERVKGCDLCLTGEGRLDGQSLSGKACLGVAQAAKKHGVPTVALVGSAADDAMRTLEHGLAGYRVIGEGLSQDESIRRASELLEHAAATVTGEAMRRLP